MYSVYHGAIGYLLYIYPISYQDQEMSKNLEICNKITKIANYQ